MLSYTKAFTVS